MMAPATTSGAIRYDLDSFLPKGPKTDFSLIGSNGYTYAKMAIQQDFEVGPVGLGIDAKVYLPTQEGAPYPADFQFFTIRKASYTHNDIAKIEYGKLENITYGYGLLIDDYNSSIGGESGEFTFRKSGIKTSIKLNPIQLDAMGTAGSVYAGRVTYDLPGITVLDAPVRMGASYITDEDGLSEKLVNGQVSRPRQSGYGLDIGIPLAGDFLVAYSEYAKLVDYGDGISAGVKGNILDLLKYRAEYQSFGRQFMPGYFNTTYEATSFNPITDFPVQSQQGVILSASAGNPTFLPISAGLQCEFYSDRSLVTAAVGWTGFMGTHGVVNYTVPFQNSANSIVDSSVYFESGNMFDYVVNARRISYQNNSYTESISVGVQVKTDRLLSYLLQRK